jgi:hypothetical protein
VARVVILSFTDNDAAEAFVEHTLEAQSAPNGGIPLAISAHIVAHAQIEAVVARPTAWCQCRIVGMTQFFREKRHGHKVGGKFIDPADRQEYILAMGRHVKTERFGWLIHEKCKRPGYFVVRDFIRNMLVGVGCNNLLDEFKEKLAQEESYHEDRDETRREERKEEASNTQ